MEETQRIIRGDCGKLVDLTVRERVLPWRGGDDFVDVRIRRQP